MATGSQLKLLFIATFAAAFSGIARLVQAGTVAGLFEIIKLSCMQGPTALPVSLKGVIVTKTVAPAAKLVGNWNDVALFTVTLFTTVTFPGFEITVSL